MSTRAPVKPEDNERRKVFASALALGYRVNFVEGRNPRCSRLGLTSPLPIGGRGRSSTFRPFRSSARLDPFASPFGGESS